MHRLPVLAVAALLITAFTLPGPIPPHQQLAYRLPAQPTATYHVVDTTRLTLSLPTGPMDGSGNSSFTFAATFTDEGDGVRVSGELTAFAAQSNDPFAGTSSLSESAAGVRDFELVLGSQGVGEVVTGALQSLSGDLPIFADPYEVMFPRLPEGEVRPGDSWVDTVGGTVAQGQFSRVADYAYTLVGDTIVDGRAHLRVDFSADVRLSIRADYGGGALTGSEVGFFLWDVARGLAARAEVSRVYGGTLTMPDGSSMDVKAAAETRARLDDGG